MFSTATVSQMVVALLSPAIPYLLKGGEQAWGEASKKIGAETFETVKSVWLKLTTRNSPGSDPTSKASEEIIKAAAEVASNPSDPDAQAAMRYQIKKLLTGDPELASEIASTLEKAQSKTQTTTRIGGVDISGGATINNSGSIVGGNQSVQ